MKEFLKEKDIYIDFKDYMADKGFDVSEVDNALDRE